MSSPHDETRRESMDAAQSPPPAAHFTLESLIGQVLDERYQLDELVGTGAMGAVFRAHQVRLRRTVAIKVPRPELCTNPTYLGRFEREALSMAKVVHENVVQIFDVFVAPDGTQPSFIAMEFVEGPELEHFLRDQQTKLTVAAVLDLLEQIARGIDAAHLRGIVHRDIKPSNIIVTLPQRIAKIMDFGIARVEMENVFATQETTTMGTPAFMAPEQVLGKQVTSAVDIYAFAMMIYRLLTRQIAFDVKSATSLLYAQVQEPPIPIHERNPRLPASLSAALASALEKDPNKRPQRAVDVHKAIAEALDPLASLPFSAFFVGEGKATTTPTESLRRTRKGWLRRHRYNLPLLIGVTGIAVVGLVTAGVLISTMSSGREESPINHVDESSPDANQVAGVMIIETGGSNDRTGGDSDRPDREPDDLEVIPATPVPSTATPTPMPSPSPSPSPSATPPSSPTPRPTAQPTPSMTPRRSPTPVPTISTPSPVPTPTLADPRFSGEQPLPIGSHRNRILREIKASLVQRTERPLRILDEDPARNDMVRVGGPTADAILQANRDLADRFRLVFFSFEIRTESHIWPERGDLQLNLTVTAQPRHRSDMYRTRIYESRTPLTAGVVLEDGMWKLVRLTGELPGLEQAVKEAQP